MSGTRLAEIQPLTEAQFEPIGRNPRGGSRPVVRVHGHDRDTRGTLEIPGATHLHHGGCVDEVRIAWRLLAPIFNLRR